MISNRDKIIIRICVACVAATVLCLVIMIVRANKTSVINISWDPSYVESESDYNEYVAKNVDWNTYIPESEEQYVSTYKAETSLAYSSVDTFSAEILSRTLSDEEIIMLSETDAWTLITGGRFSSYPNVPFKQIKSSIEDIQKTNTSTISVRCWYWSNPSDETDMSKTTVTKTFAVNNVLVNMFIHIFEDIYNDPSQPIINIADKGMGTWVIRGKNHNDNSTLSAHSLGCCIDINPSTGSFYVDNVWYGNAYGQKSMPTSIWNVLPETHNKYHVLYQDSPIVKVFKSYGFVWGGDWKSGTDSMHFSFIGDGGNAREVGQRNYVQQNSSIN